MAVRQLRTTEQMRDDKLAEMSEEQLTCGAYGHKWPSEQPGAMKPGKAPRGLTAVPVLHGAYQVRERCLNKCGRIRTWHTLPGGRFDVSVTYQYAQESGKPWVVVHDDEGYVITRRDKKATLWDAASPVASLVAAEEAQDSTRGVS